MKIKTVALNDKGNLKPIVRKEVMKYVTEHPEVFADAVKVEGKNAFTLEALDDAGNTIFVNFDVTVSTMAAADRAERKSKPKAKAPAEDVTIELD